MLDHVIFNERERSLCTRWYIPGGVTQQNDGNAPFLPESTSRVFFENRLLRSDIFVYYS